MGLKIWYKENRYILIILIVGLILRLIRIGSRPIWYDEAIAILRAEKGISGILQGTLGKGANGEVADVHPPGYFIVLWGYMKIFGNTILAGRSLSVIFGMVCLLVGNHLSKFVLGKSKSFIPLLILVISPFHIHFSQEIRMYGLVALALLIATFALFMGIAEDKLLWWVVFAVSSAAAQYSHQVACVYLISLAFIPVFQRNKKAILHTFYAGIAAIVLYLPWLINLFSQLASTNTYWIVKPKLSRFLTLFVVYVSGVSIRSGWVFPIFGNSMFVIVFGVIGSVRILRNETGNKAGLWFGYLAITPPILLWLISQIQPLYLERVLIASILMFALWIGYVIAHKLTPMFEKYLLVSLLLIASSYGFFEHIDAFGFPYAPYKEIGKYMESNMARDEILIHVNKLSYLPMYYYFDSELNQAFIADEEGSGADTLSEPTQAVLGIAETKTLEDAISGRDSFYVAFYQDAISESAALYGLDARQSLEWLERNYSVESIDHWDELWIYHFVPK